MRGQFPPAPPPPRGRRISGGVLIDDGTGRGAWIPWKVEALVVLLFVLFLLWFWPGIAERLRVQTSALDCPPPAEHEQLHIIVRVRQGRLSVDECMYVGSEGTYRSAGR